jgi:ubiquinone/menaquinone biosynthesis C-methylase UbiE/uncharacterized protein YbaR (Trm112 family)
MMHVAVEILACPECLGDLSVQDEKTLQCTKCDKSVEIIDNVVMMQDKVHPSFFDMPCELLLEGEKSEVLWSFSHLNQSKIIEKELKQGDKILDIGCGRTVYYSRPEGANVIAIDPSFASMRENKMADMRVCSNAERLPVHSNKISVAIFFYAIHHFVGNNVGNNKENVQKALSECWRILKPGGSIFIVEMTLNPWARKVQGLYWNAGRKLLKERLDAFMYTKEEIIQILESNKFTPLKERYLSFDTQAFKWIPVILRFPWINLPKILVPTTSTLFHWVK